MNSADPAEKAMGTAADAVLSTIARPVETAAAEALLERHYGIVGRAAPLAGERDHNFRIATAEGASYVLKISHPAEAADVVRAQDDALDHAAAVDPTLPVPRIVRNLDGNRELLLDVTEGPPRLVRLLTFLEGTMLYQTPHSPGQDRALGAFLARLGLALSDFRLAGRGPALLWDLAHLPRSRDKIPWIEDAVVRSRVEQAYDGFERHALGLFASLRAQVIHNDMNPYNVVVDPGDPARVTGMIDFGDMVHGPLASDIAVGASYRWSFEEHPLAGAARFLAGYASVRPLLDEEVAIMTDLLRARLALTITIANWQAREFPENRAYVLRLHSELRGALRHLSAVSREEARRFLRQRLAEES